MLAHLLAAVADRVDGGRTLAAVRALARHHRIQASPGYDAAAAWLEGELRAARLTVEVERVAADGRTRHLGFPMPEGWECTRAHAELHGAHGAEPLADFAAAPLSLVQRSAPAAGRFPLVAVDGGTRAADYAGVDVRGRVVLTRGAVQRVHELAVVERGAAGLLAWGRRLLPPVRTEAMDRDALAYTSFWWAGEAPRGWGFVASPARGEALRARLAAGEAVTLAAHVDSRRFPTTIPLVTATLPGPLPGEVLLTAHLCHPQPGANDNASGAAAALEAARALAALAAAGALPAARRTLRVLWMPEFTGTYAWLGRDPARAARTVAALNLDMVGEDQEACGSTLRLEQAPHFLGSFADELLLRALEADRARAPRTPAPLRAAEVPYSGGSDHAVWLDPAAGVPCPLLIQWPDRYYHSDLDRPERCDPESLALAARLAATYAGFLAGAGADELAWLVGVTARGARRRLLAALGQPDPRRAAAAERLRGQRALASLARLAHGVPPGHALAGALSRALPDAADELEGFHEGEIVPALAAAPPLPPPAPDDRRPARRPGGLLAPMRWLAPGWERLSPAAREDWLEFEAALPGGATTGDLAWFACDGRRSVGEIAALVAAEQPGVDAAHVAGLFERTAALGLSDWRGEGGA